MARGPRKHLKRLHAPKHWMLSKLGGNWAPRPSTGPHKLRECLPLSLILRNRLKYSLTRRETLMAIMRRNVAVDGKIRTDINYPAGFMDVVQIPKTDEHFRLMFDVKGRFVLHRLQAKEAAIKLCKVLKVSKASKASIGRNPLVTGQAAAIPYAVTHDGRTLRFIDPTVKANDTVVLDIKTGKTTGIIRNDIGAVAMITKGANIGRIGTIVSKEAHPGTFDIIFLKDQNNNVFSTRSTNIFVIASSFNSLPISLPRGKGIKKSILEEKH